MPEVSFAVLVSSANAKRKVTSASRESSYQLVLAFKVTVFMVIVKVMFLSLSVVFSFFLGALHVFFLTWKCKRYY